MINRVVLVGRMTKDAELRYSQSGVAIASFSIAVNRTFTNQNGEREADFINIVTFRKQAENVANFVGKGSLVGIDGRIQSRSYDNSEGKRVYVTEVVADNVQFLEPKGGNSTQNQNNERTNDSRNNQEGSRDPFKDNGDQIDINESDLPF